MAFSASFGLICHIVLGSGLGGQVIDEAILLADRVIVMTDRPGKIHADINIKLDRPREITVMDNSEFKRIKWEIWNFLEKEVRKELSL